MRPIPIAPVRGVVVTALQHKLPQGLGEFFLSRAESGGLDAAQLPEDALGLLKNEFRVVAHAVKMMQTVVSDFMAPAVDLPNDLRVYGGIIGGHKECGLDPLYIQHIQYAGNSLLGSIGAFGHMDQVPRIQAVRF